MILEKNSLHSDGYIFKYFVLHLFDALAKAENKELKRDFVCCGDSKHTLLNGYIKNGLKDMEGPLGIEIRYIHERYPESYGMYPILLSKIEKANLKQIIFVTDMVEKPEFGNDKIVVLGHRDVKKLAERFPKVSFMFSEYYLPGLLEYSKKKVERDNLVKRTVGEFESSPYNENKDNYIKNLIDALKEDDLVLCLGAGVSIDEGLPNWKDLIKLLIRDSLRENYNEEIKSLDLDKEFMDFSYISLGRFTKKAYQSDFYNKLKEMLYENYEDYEGYEYSTRQYSLLNYVAELCKPERNNGGIHSIITYNFDDLLEFYLKEKGIKHSVIYEGHMIPEYNTLPIYHVHGFLPKEGIVTPEMEKSVVFAEEEYHLQYKDPFSWQNIINLNLLKEKTVLFMGLSMNDPNLRRLLDIAKDYSTYPKHFAIIKDNWYSDNEKLSNIYRNIEEEVYGELGVNVIWYRSYSEINEIINKMNIGKKVFK